MAERTFGVYTLGCKVNQYETEAVAELFERAGYRQVPFECKADIYIINTCSVTGESDRKNRQVIRRAHRMNPDSIIAVMGCYAQVSQEEVRAIEGVDIVVGTQGRSSLPQLVAEVLAGRRPSACIEENIVKAAAYESLAVRGLSQHQRAFVKIQDGCDRFCTYCIIPYARGHIRSRNPEEVIEEVEYLAEAGYKEIVLTGIHLASYGRDLSESVNLAEMAARASDLYGIERIRLGSLEPVFIDEKKVRLLAENPKLCRQFHIALQSGSNAVLERMNRRYTAEEFLELVSMIRTYMPDSVFTTDMMVGFPGETEEEFCESMAFARKVGFSKIHIFPYSPRKGTAAAKMDNQISKKVKSERAARLSEVAAECERQFFASAHGKQEEVLIETRESADSEILYTGHGKSYIKIYIPEIELMMEDEIINSVKKVKMTLQKGRVYGTII